MPEGWWETWPQLPHKGSPNWGRIGLSSAIALWLDPRLVPFLLPNGPQPRCTCTCTGQAVLVPVRARLIVGVLCSR